MPPMHDPSSILTFPLILVNFKAYLESLGNRALLLARAAERVSNETGVTIGLAPQYTDIRLIAPQVRTPLFAQHVDHIAPGKHTGAILPEAVMEAGALGSLINHSEKRLRLADIDGCVRRLRQLKLLSVVCTNNPEVSCAAAALGPDMIAYEPPELIGTGISVSKAKPEAVLNAVQLIKRVNPKVAVLCGAGVSTGEDVEVALRLGTSGVLLSSGVVLAKNPYEVLSEMASACEGR